jgi:hypothetical protein
VSLFASPSAVLLDIGAKGDLGQVPTCQGFVSAGSLHVQSGLAAFLEDCSGVGYGDKGVTQVIDVNRRTLLASHPGWWAQDLAISPGGGSFVSQEVKAPGHFGPLMVADLRTGSPAVELEGLCWYEQTLLSTPGVLKPGCAAYPRTPFQFAETAVQWSPDGTMIAAVGGNGQLKGSRFVVWDALDGHVLYQVQYADVYQVIFTPDSKGLVVSLDTGLVQTLSTATWTPVHWALHAAESGVGNLGFIGFTPDGSTILAVAEPPKVEKIGDLVRRGNATLIWLDAATLEIKKTPAPVPHAV